MLAALQWLDQSAAMQVVAACSCTILPHNTTMLRKMANYLSAVYKQHFGLLANKVCIYTKEQCAFMPVSLRLGHKSYIAGLCAH